LIRKHIFRLFKSFDWENAKAWNWKGIGISVLISTTIWLFNAFNKPYTTQISYPIRFTHTQDDLLAITPPPKQIDLEVSGQGWELLRISLGWQIEPLTMRIKNPLKTNYMLSRTLLPTLIENLNGVKIMGLNNDSIRFDYDYVATKEIFLKANPKQISLAENYRITSPIFIQPQKIFFTGSSRLLAQLSDTLFVKVEGKSISENFRELLDLDYPRHEFLQPSSQKILLSFEVKEFEEKAFSVPIVWLNFPRDSSIYIKERRTELRFWKRIDEQLVVDNLIVVADFEDINWKDSTLTPFIDTNPTDSLVDLRTIPSKYKVYVKNAKNRYYRRNRDR